MLRFVLEISSVLELHFNPAIIGWCGTLIVSITRIAFAADLEIYPETETFGLVRACKLTLPVSVTRVPLSIILCPTSKWMIFSLIVDR